MKNFERFRAPVPSNENPDPGNKPSFLQPTSLVVLWACLLGLCSLFARTGVAGQIPVAALTLLACLIARNAGPVLPGFLGACSAAALGVFLENLGSVSMGAGAILYFLLFGGPVAVFVVACLLLLPSRQKGETGNPQAVAPEQNPPHETESPDADRPGSPAGPARTGERDQGLAAQKSRFRLCLILAAWVCVMAAGLFWNIGAFFFQVLMTALTLFCCFLSGDTRAVVPGFAALCVSLGMTIAILETWGEHGDFLPALTYPAAVFVLAYALTYPLGIPVSPLSPSIRRAMRTILVVLLLLLLWRIATS